MAKASESPTKRPRDLEVLEEIQDKIIEELRSKEINPKVGDLLKALELKMKLKLPEEEKQKIWELINQLRREELPSETEETTAAESDASE
jgi:hypothetical protein